MQFRIRTLLIAISLIAVSIVLRKYFSRPFVTAMFLFVVSWAIVQMVRCRVAEPSRLALISSWIVAALVVAMLAYVYWARGRWIETVAWGEDRQPWPYPDEWLIAYFGWTRMGAPTTFDPGIVWRHLTAAVRVLVLLSATLLGYIVNPDGVLGLRYHYRRLKGWYRDRA